MSNLEQFTAFLHEEIPLVRAMQLAVTAWDGRTVSLTAPLAPNQNHADTAFGGSISTMGILAGYSLVHLLLQDREVSSRIIIQQSHTDYLRPVDTEIVATATLPDAPVPEDFLGSVQRKRRGRISIASQILSRGAPAATHTGLYIAILY